MDEFTWLLATVQNLEKNDDSIPKKRKDRQMEGWTDPILKDPIQLQQGVPKEDHGLEKTLSEFL